MRVSMPKTSMNEDRSLILWKHNIGFAGQFGWVQTEPQTL